MARQHESKYKFTYRRTNKLTPDTVRKLEEAAGVRLNVKESCAYAGISRDTYYRWLEKVPGLSDRLEDLRANPIIRAKRRIVSQIDIDTNTAFRYLEKENPKEYGERLHIDHTEQIAHQEGFDPKVEAVRNEYHAKMRELTRQYYRDKKNEKKES